MVRNYEIFGAHPYEISQCIKYPARRFLKQMYIYKWPMLHKAFVKEKSWNDVLTNRYMNVVISKGVPQPHDLQNRIFYDLVMIIAWYLGWGDFKAWQTFSKFLVNRWSLLFQKGTQVGILNFFHFWFFVAFNSRDMTMLWVLNLYSTSSLTKLWKWIFDLRSQKNFLTLKVGT